MCAQLPLTYNLWEGPEDDWVTVETCSPIVISKNKCCADVKTDLFIPTPCQSLYFPLATSGLQPPAHSACHFCSLSLGYHYQQHLYERQLERNIRKYYGRGGRVKHGGHCGGGPHTWLVTATWAYSTDQGIRELRFLKWQIFRFWSSELWHHVVWQMVTNILEEFREFTGSPKK